MISNSQRNEVNENYKKTEMEQDMEKGELYMEHNLKQSKEGGLEQPVSGYYMKTEIEKDHKITTEEEKI